LKSAYELHDYNKMNFTFEYGSESAKIKNTLNKKKIGSTHYWKVFIRCLDSLESVLLYITLLNKAIILYIVKIYFLC
jgi:hypothetical protein